MSLYQGKTQAAILHKAEFLSCLKVRREEGREGGREEGRIALDQRTNYGRRII
jgi:hypothetical protein